MKDGNLGPTLADLELMNRLANDDEKAFLAIYQRHWLTMYQLAYGVLRERDAAEDIVQDIFLSIWSRRKVVKIVNIEAYLHQSVRFSLSKIMRNRRSDRLFHERLNMATIELLYTHPALFKENEELLRVLLDELPDDCREIFELSREEELTYSEISEKMGISSATVAKKISRALAFLRARLQIEFCLFLVLHAFN